MSQLYYSIFRQVKVWQEDRYYLESNDIETATNKMISEAIEPTLENFTDTNIDIGGAEDILPSENDGNATIIAIRRIGGDDNYRLIYNNGKMDKMKHLEE
jgi:hypothetical protein